MAILRVRDDKGNIIDIPAIKGDKGEKGETGTVGFDELTQEQIESLTGVYVGAGEMPQHCNVQIDPTAEPTSPEALVTRSTAKITFLGEREVYDKYDLGLSCVLQENGKCYIFDLGSNTQPLINFINNSQNNVTSIDGIIISHFHDDHIGGTDESFRSFLDSCGSKLESCKFYLPHQANNTNIWTDEYWTKIFDGTYIKSRTAEFQEALREKFGNGADNRIVTPDNDGYKVTVSDDLSITFYNLDTSYFGTYIDNCINCAGNIQTGAPYNNWSMISIIEHCNNKIAITGDIEQLAQDYNYDAFRNIDVLQIEHHNENYISSKKYLRQLYPKIAVIPEYNDTDYQDTDTLKRLNPTVDRVLGVGGELYSTGGVYNPNNKSTSGSSNVEVVSTERGVYVSSNQVYLPFRSFGLGGVVDKEVYTGGLRYKKYADGTFDLYGTMTSLEEKTAANSNKYCFIEYVEGKYVTTLPFEISGCSFLGTHGTDYAVNADTNTITSLVLFVSLPDDKKKSDTIEVKTYDTRTGNYGADVHCRFHMHGTYR